MPDKYIGRVVDLIYEDRHGTMTKRRIRIEGVHGGKVKGFDLAKQALRVFVVDRILALQPVSRHVS